MELDELLVALDLESPAEFEDFEHFADLMECDSYIEYSDFYAVLSEASCYTLELLSQNYFDEMLANLPDNIVDIYALLSSIQKCLIGLSANVETIEGRRSYVDELYKFRTWYVAEGTVCCTDRRNDHMMDVSVCEAIALCRVEKLNEGSYEYNFDHCMNYELDEYTMSLSAITANAEDYIDENEEDYDPYLEPEHAHDCDDDCHRHEHHHGEASSYQDHEHHDEEELAYTVGLVDRENPVIDGEYEDDEELE